MNRMIAEKMLKDFINSRPLNRFRYREGCPFYSERYNLHYHDLCAILFPGWGKKYLKDMMGKWTRESCPCMVMSKSYVKRKARRFAKYG